MPLGHTLVNDSQFCPVAWSYLKTKVDFLNHLIKSNKMGNVPICYHNIKLPYFSHNQFLYYRLLGRGKEQKKKKKKKSPGICFITLITIYYKPRGPKINYCCCYERLNNIVSTTFFVKQFSLQRY